MSLIEVMIAIVLLMIVSLALMQTSLVGYQANLQNTLREEATRVADEAMGSKRDTPFPDLVSGAADVYRNFRGFSVKYTVTTTVTVLGALNSKQVNVLVEWEYRGKKYNHSITSIMGQT